MVWAGPAGQCHAFGRKTCVVSPFTDLPVEPLSDHYGLDRGTPLDRRYIEVFLGERSGLIRGLVLEVQDDAYTVRFGADRVAKSTVVDINRSNTQATLIADLEQPGSLSAETYDCIILTQTLHLLRQPGLCLENCHRALRRPGVLLATAPGQPCEPDLPRWRLLALHAGRHGRVVLSPLGW